MLMCSRTIEQSWSRNHMRLMRTERVWEGRRIIPCRSSLWMTWRRMGRVWRVISFPSFFSPLKGIEASSKSWRRRKRL